VKANSLPEIQFFTLCMIPASWLEKLKGICFILNSNYTIPPTMKKLPFMGLAASAANA
jgi:hypothetical protein